MVFLNMKTFVVKRKFYKEMRSSQELIYQNLSFFVLTLLILFI
ncbi:hypothetical protein DFP82_11122 [Psychrobacter fozii]|uniref:Uncharacterized protein n=1 Tax=Psychrobacter fozii TaxID=198480 RepID=A0A2V4U914_9GAMM|nr:hypothetical protein DFP82_11122 [Psychrobacter fozii]